MHTWVDGADEVYAGAEEVFCFGRGQDVMSKGRVSAGGVDGSSVFVEGSVRFNDAEVKGRPVDLGDCGVLEALPDLLRVKLCRRHDVGVAGYLGVFRCLSSLGSHRHWRWKSSNDCQ